MVRDGAASVEESGTMLAVDEAAGGTSGTESLSLRQAATDPRQAAGTLRRELAQLDSGDVAGASAILAALVEFLEEEPGP
jgi:hypothetical protein